MKPAGLHNETCFKKIMKREKNKKEGGRWRGKKKGKRRGEREEKN